MKGIINVNKEKGWTSFDVVAYLRRVLGIKKIGHLGTLDPMATGVLPITIGSATKLFDMFLKKEKTYIAEFEFGYLTDTLDATGNTLETCEKIPTISEIQEVLPNFLGEISQMPPLFSAKKVNGRKACDVARNGGEIELKPSIVKISKLNILSFDKKILKLEIECGAGTYIRSLCRDIANNLNSLATMTSLIRTKVGVFSIDDAILIKNKDKEYISSKILPIDCVFDYPKICDDEICKRLLNGQKISDFEVLKRFIPYDAKVFEGNRYCLYLENEFIGIAEIKDGCLKLFKYFN